MAVFSLYHSRNLLAGIHDDKIVWIPAFAGMTILESQNYFVVVIHWLIWTQVIFLSFSVRAEIILSVSSLASKPHVIITAKYFWIIQIHVAIRLCRNLLKLPFCHSEGAERPKNLVGDLKDEILR